MYPDYDHPKHETEHTKIAKTALKQIAKKSGVPYPKVLANFYGGCEDTALLFWAVLWQEDDGMDKKYNEIHYCPGCKKFDLGYDPYGSKMEDIQKALEAQILE